MLVVALWNQRWPKCDFPRPPSMRCFDWVTDHRNTTESWGFSPSPAPLWFHTEYVTGECTLWTYAIWHVAKQNRPLRCCHSSAYKTCLTPNAVTVFTCNFCKSDGGTWRREEKGRWVDCCAISLMKLDRIIINSLLWHSHIQIGGFSFCLCIYVCRVCMFFPCLCGFSFGTQIPSYNPKPCSLGDLASLNCP